MPSTDGTPLDPARRRRRQLLWAALVALLMVAQTALLALTLKYESSRSQDDTEAFAVDTAADLRRELLQALHSLQALALEPVRGEAWRAQALALMKARPALRHVERRSEPARIVDTAESPFAPRPFQRMARGALGLEAEIACAAAARTGLPTFSRSYYVPLPGGVGQEMIDVCVPGPESEGRSEHVVGTLALAPLLDAAVAARPRGRYELSLVEGDGTRLARAGAGRGAGVFVAERVVDLPGNTLRVRADSAAGRPGLIPNLATALVLGLSIALFAVVLLLARDVRRRAMAERLLAESLAFRQAMEDSLITGLRARDLRGAITYVNPAFCAMVGFSEAELRAEPPPYWPPEHAAEYQRRQEARQPAGNREGIESVFMRKNGERFAVVIYEAPLVNADGSHGGWMSAVLDVSAQRRVEELSRQQQERLQATARLATVGEMASLLSHELNQPLAAISSYASGSLNLIDEGPADPTLPETLREPLRRIAEQAERAGRVIQSVHDFVRRREQAHELVTVRALADAVWPLVRLQARKSGTRIELDIPAAPPISVRGDRTMLEQVLLNLTRNGLQAMEPHTPPEQRVLTLRVRQTHPQWVSFSVIDAGPGIAPDVARRLFTPFFTTRAEGMGLGLSLCRTVVEQHGGALDHGPGPGGRGTEFRFTLPAPKRATLAGRDDEAQPAERVDQP
jgi:two-component system sensor histidine kinase DctS